MKNSKNRNIEIDMIRGIGIILVVCGHIGLFKRFAYLFHVPLFFFTSGYFFDESQKVDVFISKAIKRYYFPFVIAEVIFMIFHNMFADIIGYEMFTRDDVRLLLPKMLCFQNVCQRLGQLWFLLALFSVGILYYILYQLIGKRYLTVVLGIMLLIHYLFFAQTNIYEFEVCALFEILLVMTPVYGIGYLYRKNELVLRQIVCNRGIVIGGGLLIILTLMPETYYDVRTNFYVNTLYAFGAMLVGIYFCLCFVNMFKMKGRLLANILAYMGKKSLWILIGQSVVYKIIGIILENKINIYVIKVLQLLMALFIPLGVAYLFDKFRQTIKGLSYAENIFK